MSLVNQKAYTEVPEDWRDELRNCRLKPTPFEVTDCSKNFDFQNLTSFLSPLYPTKCSFSTRPTRMLKFCSKDNRLIFHKSTYMGFYYNSKFENKPIKACRKRTQNNHNKKGVGTLRKLYQDAIPIKKSKWKDLQDLTAFLEKPESRLFYQQLTVVVVEQSGESDDESGLKLITSKIKSKKNQSICPTPEEVLLYYVLNNKTNYLKTLFNAKLLKCRYSNPEYNYSVDILSIACVGEVKAETVKCLIELGADIRCRDVDNWEPFHYAAVTADDYVLKVIIDELKNRRFNLDEVLAGNSQEIIPSIKTRIYQISPNETVDDRLEETDQKDFLFNLVKNKEEDKFLNCKGAIISNYVDSDNGEMTLLQFACKNGTKRIVKCLIEKNADKNLTTSNKKETPLEISAKHDFHEIFEILIKEYKNEEQIPPYIISKFLPRLLQHYDDTEDKYKSSCDLLLKKIKANKNIYDLNEGNEVTGYTPLHYAARYADTATITNLLDIGASLVCKNRFGFMPVQYLDYEKLQAVLDNYVQGDSFKRNADEFEVSINFRALLPCIPKKVGTKIVIDQSSKAGANNTDNVLPKNGETTTESTCLLNPNNSNLDSEQLKAVLVESVQGENNETEGGTQNVPNNGDTTTKATSNSKESNTVYETDLVFDISELPEVKYVKGTKIVIDQSSTAGANNTDEFPKNGETTTESTCLLNPNNSNLDSEQLKAVLVESVHGENNEIERGSQNVPNNGDTTTKVSRLFNPNNSNESNIQSSASVATNNDTERGTQNVPNNGDTTTKATSNSKETNTVYETDLVFYISELPEVKHLLKHPVISFMCFLTPTHYGGYY
ncbi:unnamed protein product [Diabrotica balteata]|uniref:Uncharacterized protein n=1 Tax=Diabrotica balteata TaxID=107213 RepID=A0A9N9X8W8_DIABA|nr:unnamed protein product [Diabrotica balteata]